jgi:hypothetical protein
VPFGLNIDLPEVVTIISRDLTREHAGLILNVFTETAEGRLYQQEIDENDEVTDTQMLTPPVLDLNALDSKEVRKMKRLVRIDRAINKVLEVTGINKLYGLLRKDKEKGTVTAEDYKNLAAAA